MTRPSLISAVIPTYNEAAVIEQTIRQFDDLAGNWEILIADSGSGDRTVALASQFDTVVVDAPEGRGLGMNAGAKVATGDILLFLHADTLLPEDAHSLIVNALADPRTSATAFQLRMDRPELRFRLLSTVSKIRFYIQRTFFGDQAIAVRRADFERLGGYREPFLMEDVDLSKRLRRTGRLKMLPAEVTTSARRFERYGVFRTLTMMTVFQLLYAVGVSASALAFSYKHVRQTKDQPDVPAQPLETLRFEDENGHQVRLADLRGAPVLMVFLRWLG